MKGIIPLIVISLGAISGLSHGQSQHYKTGREKTDSAFTHHITIVSQYLQDRTANASTPWDRSVHYLERITGIPSSGDWTYFGRMGLRMEDVNEWQQWYHENKHLLAWDNKLNLILTARENADSEKYAQAYKLKVFAQNDSITVYFIGYNKNGERYRVYHHNNLMLDFEAGVNFMHSFKIHRDTTLKSDMIGFRSIQVYKKKFFGYKPIGPGTVYQNKKYLVIRRNPQLRRKFSIEFFWTDDEPKNAYWRP